MNNYQCNDLSVIGSEMKQFAGETPELDAFFGLITEKLDKGTTFDKFQDKL